MLGDANYPMVAPLHLRYAGVIAGNFAASKKSGPFTSASRTAFCVERLEASIDTSRLQSAGSFETTMLPAASERFSRVRVHREARLEALLYLANVCLLDVGEDLHLRRHAPQGRLSVVKRIILLTTLLACGARAATDQDVATQIAGLAEIDQPGIGFTEAPRMG